MLHDDYFQNNASCLCVFVYGSVFVSLLASCLEKLPIIRVFFWNISVKKISLLMCCYLRKCTLPDTKVTMVIYINILKLYLVWILWYGIIREMGVKD